jgi:methylated-DNA-[protein]-cysteine S-methyltransferase
MKIFIETIPSPVGPFSIATNEAGAVVATAFGDARAVRARLRGRDRPVEIAGGRVASAARAQVLAYFAGKRRDFDLPLAAGGTLFQQKVWTALRTIPFGETRSYRDLAALIGRPHAARAVGRANATNPICLIVPCHRVIGADGSLTGFAFGEAIKKRLLAHERALAVAARAA